MKVWIGLAACFAVLVLPGSALAAHCAPPGNAGVNEYAETIPGASCNQTPGSHHHGNGGGGRLPSGTSRTLAAQGGAGHAVAQLVANTGTVGTATAPLRSDAGNGQGGASSGSSSASKPGSSKPGGSAEKRWCQPCADQRNAPDGERTRSTIRTAPSDRHRGVARRRNGRVAADFLRHGIPAHTGGAAVQTQSAPRCSTPLDHLTGAGLASRRPPSYFAGRR